ncbi:MAG: radical SAM protein [Elusimicrobia bacterium]|nr:radical SAM protein [Candidatus Liberimonas magnetica]
MEKLKDYNKYIDIYLENGKKLFNRKNYPEALSLFRKILAIDPNYPGVHFEIGKAIYYGLKRNDAAAREFQLELKLNPSHIFASLMLGMAYAGLERYGEALTVFKKAVKLGKGNAGIEEKAHYELAQIYLKKMRYSAAAGELIKVIKINPENEHAHYLLSVAYKCQGFYDKALEEIRLSGKHAGEEKELEKKINRDKIDLIQGHNLKGNYAKALEEIKNVEAAGPKNANLLMNELEIAKNKTRLRSKVRSLDVSLTTNCNIRCKMCSLSEIPKQEISKKVKEEIIKAFPYLTDVTWVGGEVFLYPYFNELLDEAIKHKVKQHIDTNGLLIGRDMAVKLIENNVCLTFSIDGTTKEVFEGIRKGSKFSLLMEKLDMINKLREKINPDYRIQMNTVVMRSNYRQIESFVEFAAEYNINGINYLMLNPFGLKEYDEDVFTFKRDGKILSFIYTALNKAKTACRKHNIVFTSNMAPEVLLQGFKDKKYKTGRKKRGAKPCNCLAPWIRLRIDFNGIVYPYANFLCRNAIGDLNSQALEDIWNGKKMIQYRKMLISGAAEKICSLKKVYKRIPFELLYYT